MRKFYTFTIFIFFLSFVSCSNSSLKEVRQLKVEHTEETGIYLTLDGLFTRLNLLKQNHDDRVRLYEIGKSDKLHRPIPLVRIGNNSDNNYKRFLFVAGTHGDEAACVSAIIYTMENIFTSGLIDTLDQLNENVDFIPVHNPDGYAENERKNGFGVDINRSFPIGSLERKIASEADAVVRLINHFSYSASLFFHSANEQKYENLVRVPIEYNRSGQSILDKNFSDQLLSLKDKVIIAGNKNDPMIAWHSSSEMVNVSGIASDWCVSGFINELEKSIVKISCEFSHPSLTIELCYPKQPMDEMILLNEKKETYDIIRQVVTKF